MKNKTLLITGGTGSFGRAVLNKFLDSDIAEIRIFSRDEKKQDDMRNEFKSNKIKFYVGDVREYKSILSATQNVDYIFHAAALKQVPSCEFYPLEAFKTNVIGTENVIDAAIANAVVKIICLSTDKAVYPINAMGISKAMMEKVAIAKSRNSRSTSICVTRYGNVMASRGSVIPLFLEQILSNKPISLTDPNMTRFMMTLEDAVNLVMYAFLHGNSGEIFVQKSQAATLQTLVDALFKIFNIENKKINIIGTRHGEKLYETLLSREEMYLAKSLSGYFKIPPDVRDLNYDKYIKKGDIKISISSEYNSDNAARLDVHQMKNLLLKLPLIQNALK